METLMIVIVLTFVPVPDTKNVEIRYEAKFGVRRTLAECQAVQKAFEDRPDKNHSVIVLCAESKEPAGAPAKSAKRQDT